MKEIKKNDLERELLLSTLSGANSDKEIIRSLINPNMDWKSLLKKAQNYKILPTFSYTFLIHNLLEEIPAPIAAYLKDVIEENTAKNSIREADVGLLAGILKSADVNCIFLKGIALQASYFKDKGIRQTDDIDFLVSEKDVDKTRNLLLANGYTYPPEETRLCEDGLQRHEHAPNARGYKHIEALVSPLGTVVEPHFQLEDQGPAHFSALFKRSELVELGGQTISIPAPGDLLMHLCDHVVISHEFSPLYIPRHLSDLHALINSGHIDVKRVLNLLSSDAWWPVGISLYLLAMSQKQIPWFLKGILFPSDRALGYYEQVVYFNELSHRLKRDLFRNPGFLLRKLFPTKTYMEQKFSVNRESVWIYPLYVYRLLFPILPHLRDH